MKPAQPASEVASENNRLASGVSRPPGGEEPLGGSESAQWEVAVFAGYTEN